LGFGVSGLSRLPPPRLPLTGARLESESSAPERRAIKLVAEAPLITITLHPATVCVNPVFEIRNAPARLSQVILNDSPLPHHEWEWDDRTLWLNLTLREPSSILLALFDARRQETLIWLGKRLRQHGFDNAAVDVG